MTYFEDEADRRTKRRIVHDSRQDSTRNRCIEEMGAARQVSCEDKTLDALNAMFLAAQGKASRSGPAPGPDEDVGGSSPIDIDPNVRPGSGTIKITIEQDEIYEALCAILGKTLADINETLSLLGGHDS